MMMGLARVHPINNGCRAIYVRKMCDMGFDTPLSNPNVYSSQHFLSRGLLTLFSLHCLYWDLIPLKFIHTWRRHKMETFSALLALCAGNSPVTGEFPAQGPVTRSFDVFFDLLLNIWLSKQAWGWWFETPWRPLWRHCNVCLGYIIGIRAITPLCQRQWMAYR